MTESFGTDEESEELESETDSDEMQGDAIIIPEEEVFQ